MRYINKYIVALTVAMVMWALNAPAQTLAALDKQAAEHTDSISFDKNAPVFNSYSTPKKYYIRKVNIHGVKYIDKSKLLITSGIVAGDSITLPGGESYFANSIDRLWRQRYFADVKMGATIEGDSLDVEIILQERPRVHNWYIIGEGIGQGKQRDLLEKLKLKPNVLELSAYNIDKNKKLLTEEFVAKGFRNVKVTEHIEQDSVFNNAVNVTFKVERNSKVKIGLISFSGNNEFPEKRLRRTLKKTKQKSINFLKSSKLNMEEYKEDKNLLIDFYNSRGYRNATILSDSIYDLNDKRIGIHINLSEGNKFYIRNVKWVGNSVYETEDLERIFSTKPGDVYDKKSMHKSLGIGREMDPEQTSIASLYQNNGYLMSQIDPSEVVVGQDSIDMEIRIFEGNAFTINDIGISGNERVNDEVIRREIDIFPGQLYNRAMLVYTIRQLSNMGHFDPEKMNPDIQPVSTDKVNISFPLEEQASDQFNIAGGWGSGSFVGSVGITLNNISTRNMFKKGTWLPYPMGQNQKFSVSGQTNGTYYKAISASFTDPWVGGRKPNSLTVSAHWSEQNDAYYIWQSASMYFRTTGIAVGLGKRLNWPDPYFTLYGEAQYRHYGLSNWDYFIMKDGGANELSLKVAFGRSTVNQPIYPREGSEFSVTVSATPPVSLWDGKDYSDESMSDRDRYKWIEYHRWELRGRWFQALTRNSNLVLMAHAEMGYLGHYNKHKLSPFQRFEVGGDGMTGYTMYGVDIIGLRGYEDGALDPINGNYSIAYNKYTMELRYPVILKPSSQIYVLGFLEGGNGFSSWKEFSPFKIKRSAGLGVRLYLPIVGLLGLDWGWGFDAPAGMDKRSGSRFHFSMGQSF